MSFLRRRRPPTAALTAIPRRRQVVEQGLTPFLARRACGNAKITGPVLSRAIKQAVVEHARPEIDRRRAAKGMIALASGGGEGEGEGGPRKRTRRSSTDVAHAPFVSPHPGEAQAVAIAVTTNRASFSAPYLKGGSLF